MTGRQWEWSPRMAVVVAAWIVAGYIASRVLPDWLWSLVGFVAFGLLLWTFHRRNQRKEQEMPPKWAPDKPPNPN